MSSTALLHCMLSSPGEVRVYFVYKFCCSLHVVIFVIIWLGVTSGRHVGFRHETFWNNPESPSLRRVSKFGFHAATCLYSVFIYNTAFIPLL